MSRRITRSQTVCLAKPPIIVQSVNKKAKSKRTKKCGRHSTPATNQPALNEITADVLSPALKKACETAVKLKSGAKVALNENLTPAKVKVGKRASRDVITVVNDKQKTPKGKPTIIRDIGLGQVQLLGQSLDVQKTDVQVNESQRSDTVSSDHSKTPNVSQAPHHPLRRSLRLTTKLESAPTSKVDLPTLRVAQQLKIPRRRFTIHSLQSTSDGMLTSASKQEQRKSTDARIAKEVKKSTRISARKQSKVSNKVLLTKAARESAPDENINKMFSEIQSKGSDKVLLSKDAEKSTSDENITGTQSRAKVPLSKAVRKSAPDGNTADISTGIKSKRNEMAAIIIPENLKRILLNDSNFINVKRKMYEIPFDLNVAEVIEGYATLNNNTAHTSPMPITKIFYSIIQYFDMLIGNQLLYESERVQYEVLLEKFPGVPMSKVYPPIYLLRLFVQLNKLLHLHNLDGDTFKHCTFHLNEFVKYLTENKSTFFGSNASHLDELVNSLAENRT